MIKALGDCLQELHRKVRPLLLVYTDTDCQLFSLNSHGHQTQEVHQPPFISSIIGSYAKVAKKEGRSLYRRGETRSCVFIVVSRHSHRCAVQTGDSERDTSFPVCSGVTIELNQIPYSPAMRIDYSGLEPNGRSRRSEDDLFRLPKGRDPVT